MTLADELKKTAAKATQTAARTRAQKAVERQERLEKAARPQAEKIIASLKQDMKKAAKQGRTSFTYLSSFYDAFDEIEDTVVTLVESYVWRELRAEGIYCSHKTAPPFGSDGNWTSAAWVAWQ